MARVNKLTIEKKNYFHYARLVAKGENMELIVFIMKVWIFSGYSAVCGDLLCIYFFIPQFKYMKFIYS